MIHTSTISSESLSPVNVEISDPLDYIKQQGRLLSSFEIKYYYMVNVIEYTSTGQLRPVPDIDSFLTFTSRFHHQRCNIVILGGQLTRRK